MQYSQRPSIINYIVKKYHNNFSTSLSQVQFLTHFLTHFLVCSLVLILAQSNKFDLKFHHCGVFVDERSVLQEAGVMFVRLGAVTRKQKTYMIYPNSASIIRMIAAEIVNARTVLCPTPSAPPVVAIPT